jgi:transposase
LQRTSGFLRIETNGNNALKKTFTYSEKSEEKRAEYLAELKNVPENQRVYVDECGCNEYYGRERGRALRGVKIEAVKRGQKYERTNVIAGYCGKEIYSPKTCKHTMNSSIFEDWFEFDLLSVVPCGYTIIMDNASFHRKKKLWAIAERYGVKLMFLPTYSPDYNPIEKFWANLKKWLKKHLITFDGLAIAILHYCVRFLI